MGKASVSFKAPFLSTILVFIYGGVTYFSGSVSGAGGNGGFDSAVTRRFSDLPPCPGMEGFYYAEEMRSCYHLEPPSVMCYAILV